LISMIFPTLRPDVLVASGMWLRWERRLTERHPAGRPATESSQRPEQPDAVPPRSGGALHQRLDTLGVVEPSDVGRDEVRRHEHAVSVRGGVSPAETQARR
jgi:hypothetical protein